MSPIDYRPPRVMTKNNLQQWIENTRQKLEKSRECSILEIYAIASDVLGKPREWLITHGNTSLIQAQLEELEKKIGQLTQGVPLPYITHRQAFYGLDFYVTPEVLIPRPETELMVETAIDWLRDHPGYRTMIDIGTGSGNIAIALVDNIPDLYATAIDLSDNALYLAQINIERLRRQQNITLLRNDLLTGLSLRADLITANLPYIPSDRLPSLDVSRYEPHLALDGGVDGFVTIRRLLAQLPFHLNHGGLALLEIDISHDELSVLEATKIMTSAKISVIHDLAKLPRLLVIQT
jgi:release factor glutamine methyltransferase